MERPAGQSVGSERIAHWLAALEERHLADLRWPEVVRALRALSSWYVHRRGALESGRALDGAGKRAAFALFYGPLHFLVIGHVLTSLEARLPPDTTLVDLGCGTGVGSAAWAGLAPAGRVRIVGFDRHPWAVAESAWTWRTLGVSGHARVAGLECARWPRDVGAAIAAFTVNELTDELRTRVRTQLLEAAGRGAAVLIVEPLARAVAPWWNAWSDAFAAAGGRTDEWRVAAELPDLVHRLDRAAGLDHRVLTARSIYVPSKRRG